MGFFGSFFGSDQRKDIANANAQATSALSQGRDQAVGQYSQARDYYTPYAQQGGRANALYGDALGVNGADARSNALATYSTSNPYSQAGDDYAMKGVMRQMNSQGLSNSGNALLAAQRVGAERWDQRYNNWMNQLQGQGQQGLQATAAQAGLTQGIGDIYSGYGQQSAANAINYGNALAGTRNIGLQNLIGLGGLAINAFSPTKNGTSAIGNMAGSVNRLWS